MSTKLLSPLFLIILLFGCEKSEPLDSVTPLRIKAVRDAYMKPDKIAIGTISYKADQVVIDWSGDTDLHFTGKTLISTTYHLNSGGYAEKIVSRFDDKSEIIDQFTYSSDYKIVEIQNSFFHETMHWHYIDNEIDSISRVQATENGEIMGFYKRLNTPDFTGESPIRYLKMSGIFPFNTALPYNLEHTMSYDCENHSYINENESNKLEISNNYDGDGGERHSFITGNKINFESIVGSFNPYRKEKINVRAASRCLARYEAISTYILMPDLIPDFDLVYLFTIENEIKYVNENGNYTLYSPALVSYEYK